MKQTTLTLALLMCVAAGTSYAQTAPMTATPAIQAAPSSDAAARKALLRADVTKFRADREQARAAHLKMKQDKISNPSAVAADKAALRAQHETMKAERKRIHAERMGLQSAK